MANRDLLKEAIADAKALKETAIANAKVALEEAFEPRLKSMLSAKLEEMDKGRRTRKKLQRLKLKKSTRTTIVKTAVKAKKLNVQKK